MVIEGSIIGGFKGYTRSLDCGSYGSSSAVHQEPSRTKSTEQYILTLTFIQLLEPCGGGPLESLCYI